MDGKGPSRNVILCTFSSWEGGEPVRPLASAAKWMDPVLGQLKVAGVGPPLPHPPPSATSHNSAFRAMMISVVGRAEKA